MPADSDTAASATDTVALSSLTIVAVTEPVPTAAIRGSYVGKSLMVNVSSASTRLSAVVCTVIVFSFSPAAKVSCSPPPRAPVLGV